MQDTLTNFQFFLMLIYIAKFPFDCKLVPTLNHNFEPLIDQYSLPIECFFFELLKEFLQIIFVTFVVSPPNK